MWFLLLLLLLYSAHTQPVVEQGDMRLVLMDGSNPCEGFIGLYRNGSLGFVGHETTNIETVVCRSAQCGEPVTNQTEDAPWSIKKFWLNEVTCTGEEKHLWDCKHPGPGVSLPHRDTLMKIQCSNQVKISLDGFKCAGAVQYSTDGGQTYSGYLCEDNWGEDEGNLLCNSLNCGGFKETPRQEWMVWKKFKTSKINMEINCSGIKNISHLWQCIVGPKSCQKPASVICKDFETLQLTGDTSNVCSGRLEKMKGDDWIPVNTSKSSPDVWCQQMHCGTNVSDSKYNNSIQLNCTDNVKVVLKDKNEPSLCYGEVHIEVNGTSQPVCATTWTEKEAEVVCREKKCGRMISKKSIGTNKDGILDNVKCSGKESSLWHCRAKHDINSINCRSTAYVVCADSMKVRLKDGPGKCAGRVDIYDEGRWQRVHANGWNNVTSDTVCKHLGCGEKRKSSKETLFCHGSGEFLAKKLVCKNDNKHINECAISDQGRPTTDQAVGITCEGHKVVFLEGSKSCSGKVGINQAKRYYLSGSSETWNQEAADTVCRQMHCGKASSHTFIPRVDMNDLVWPESYTCSSNTESLFDCKSSTLPNNYNDTIATVTCSGEVNVTLTKNCWGNVNVSMGDTNGPVCADAWTKANSEKLCKNLGCGDGVLTAISEPGESEVLFTIVDCTGNENNLTQCNFVKNDNFRCKPAYVVCSGSVKPSFSETRDNCIGNVKMSYEDQLLPVCENTLRNIKTQKIICAEQKCGHSVKMIDYFGPKTDGYAISQIECSQDGSESLAACSIKPEKSGCKLGALQCSKWRKMALTPGTACSGAVSVHSEGKRSAVSIEGWTETEGETLCRGLNCGNVSRSIPTNASPSLGTTSFRCARGKKPDNIWGCENETLHLQQNKTKQQLFIQCQDEPLVALSNGCHGKLTINNIEVCASHWKNDYSHLVCHQLDCSNAIPDYYQGQKASSQKKYFHVRCDDNHYELGQCKRIEETCDGNLVSVYCVGKIEVNTTDKCGGQIQVNYRGSLEQVCPLKSYLPVLKKSLCDDCHGYNRSKISNEDKQDLKNLKIALDCTSDNLDIKYCVRSQSCDNVEPAAIYCNDYEFPTPPPVQPTSSPRVYIIVGIGFALVLLVLIVVFIRICIVKKTKNASSRKLPRQEVEFESGDYDDVVSKANEMEVLSHDGFRSETDVLMETDARSTSSFPYDDIDNVAAAQPLSSEAAVAAASGDDDSHEDGVIYEVDDPRRSYEDVEAQIIQTEAEVHDSPQTTPESDAAPPPELMAGEEDYLVPGQDG